MQLERRPLSTLSETLARKVQIRRGWVYIKRAASGPPTPKSDQEEAIDDLIRDTAVAFDFSPVLSGDRLQAQRVADDFMQELLRAVSADESPSKPTPEDLERRLQVLWPHIWRSVNGFRDRLRVALLKQHRQKEKPMAAPAPEPTADQPEPDQPDERFWSRRPERKGFKRTPKKGSWKRKPGDTTSTKRQPAPPTWRRDPKAR